jgi:hypothetical protein
MEQRFFGLFSSSSVGYEARSSGGKGPATTITSRSHLQIERFVLASLSNSFQIKVDSLLHVSLTFISAYINFATTLISDKTETEERNQSLLAGSADSNTENARARLKNARS